MHQAMAVNSAAAALHARSQRAAQASSACQGGGAENCVYDGIRQDMDCNPPLDARLGVRITLLSSDILKIYSYFIYYCCLFPSLSSTARTYRSSCMNFREARCEEDIVV